MARVNITVPDQLLQEAKRAGLNISGVAAAALAEELDRRHKIEALDVYLAELELELGPLRDDEKEAAEAWVATALSGKSTLPARAARRRRSA